MKKCFYAIEGVTKQEQGVIIYTMLNPRRKNPKLYNLCEKAINTVAKQDIDKKMLLEYVTERCDSVYISQKYFCSERKLAYLYKEYIKEAVKEYRKL